MNNCQWLAQVVVFEPLFQIFQGKPIVLCQKSSHVSIAVNGKQNKRPVSPSVFEEAQFLNTNAVFLCQSRKFNLL